MENLDQNSDSTSELSGRTEVCLKEKKTCYQPYCFSCQEICTIRCLVKQNDLFKDLSTLLQKSMKYFCRTAHTFFLRLEDFKVKSYDDFKALLSKAVPKTITTNQAAIRAMLVKLIREIPSPLVSLRPLFDLFDELVKPTHKQIGIEDKVLIGNHPGCAMVDMQQPIDKMVELINKDHSLLDYIIFQGYALFTSVSKYVADFQSKKPFVALNSGLDILIGTTCGLHKYAMTGQKSNCDQVGGFPTLGMPLPKWLWKPKTHKACQQVKNIVLWGPKGSLPTDMEMKDDTDEKKTVRRKRLTLKVDPKNIKH
ncbi:hypothetical protein Ocin01_19797 [Orchesella cincta]|uniref:Uncharacterized protein n=1 Tax=Orchesella cincta TaxID=48709 RepID=A0A1D2M1N9_ORCCI|nr:hypothetical protein Ocin01_19797 [Orchesella cincta]